MNNEVEIHVQSKDDTNFDRVVSKAEKAGDQAGSRMADRMGRSFSKVGTQILGGAAKNLTGMFSRSFGTAVSSNPMIGAGLLAALVGAAAVVGPAAGAVAAAGLVAAFGGGLAALGITFAAKSEVVKGAWKQALASMGSQMQVLSRPFERTLLAMAEIAQRTFNKFAPALSTSFKAMAGPVTSFVDTVGRAFEGLIPAIAPVTRAFTAVLAALGPAMTSAIGQVSAGLSELADSVARNPDALADLVRGLGALVVQGMSLIRTLNEINSDFAALTGGVSLLDVALAGIVHVVGMAEFGFRALAAPVTAATTVMEKLGLVERDAESATASFRSTLGDTAFAIGSMVSAQNRAKAAAENTKKATREQAAAFEDLIAKMFKLQNLSLGLSGAQINLEAAIDDATDSLKANGRTLDINTEKGRNNRRALNEIANAANRQTEAMIRSGKGTDAAGLAAERGRANFVRIARQMGLSKGEADRMARSMIAIPNVSRTARLRAEKRDLDVKLAAAKRQLADRNLTRERRAQLTADIRQLQARIRAAQSAINGLRGKTVVIRYSSTGVNLTTPSSVGRRESGGSVEAGQPYIVGERRPEMFVPDQDGTILPSVSTRRSSAGGGGGAPLVLNLHLGHGSRFVRALMEDLKDQIKIQGGDVQAVLGGVTR